MEFLVSEGHGEAAEAFARESGLETGETDDMDMRARVRDAILRGRPEEALAWIETQEKENDGCGTMRRHDALRVRLQILAFLERVRRGDVDDAVSFARAHLAEAAGESETFRGIVERAVGLLAFPNPAETPDGQMMLSLDERREVAEMASRAMLSSSTRLTKRRKRSLICPTLTRVAKVGAWLHTQDARAWRTDAKDDDDDGGGETTTDASRPPNTRIALPLRLDPQMTTLNDEDGVARRVLTSLWQHAPDANVDVAASTGDEHREDEDDGASKDEMDEDEDDESSPSHTHSDSDDSPVVFPYVAHVDDSSS